MGSGTNFAELKARQHKEVVGSWDEAQQLTLEEFDRVLDSSGCDHVAGVRQHREFAVGQRTVGACGLLD